MKSSAADSTHNTAPLLSDLVLIGGGHAHVHILKMFGMPPIRSILSSNGIQVTLISSTVLTPYSGMLPGYVAGHYDSKDIHLDLRKLCSFSGIRFLHTAAVGIVHNNEKNENGGGGGGWIICSDGRPNVRYDVLSIDVGSSPSIPADLTVHSFSSSSSALLLESSTDNTTTTTAALETNTLQGGGGGNHTVTPVKPIATFSTRWNHICQRLQQSPAGMYSPSRPFVLVVVGGGAGGIELALSVQYTLQKILRDKNARDDDALESMQVEAEAEATATATAPTVEEDNCIRIILATKGMDILPSHNKRVRDIFKRILKERNIQVKYGAEAIGVCPPTSQQSQPTHNYNDDDDDDDGTTTIPPTQQYCLKLSNESLVDHEPIYFDECLWCTSAGSSSWVKECTPFDKTEDGFFKVRDTYESVSHRGVFAAGDCCHMVDHPRPKAGVFAVRAGPILCDNLIAYLLNQPLSPHEPQKEFLGLISTGNKYAVASRGQHALEGEFLWTLKDRIDKAWMSMYQNLPSMEEQNGDDRVEEEDAENKERQVDNTNNDYLPPSLTSRGQDAMAAFAEATMRCGGCGAKVGSQTLTRVLDAVYRRRLKKYESKFSSSLNAQLPKKLDADDAAVILIPESIIAKRGEGGNKRGAMIQTIDFFRSFLLDPFIFGKIAAVHALSDCHAMGAQAHTALALAVVQFAANEEMTERTLVDMLSGASDVLDEEGCELVGGHTCEGAEQALGFTVSGFVHDTSALLRKRGGKIGDLIVLTKPIGTGAIFAADMRAKCQGELVQEALDSMVTSNRSASRIAMNLIHARLQNNNPDRGIHSCTDITGFGLCGHLLEMLLANDDDNDNENDPSQPRHDRIAAQLNLGDIPFFQGAIEASKDGITSSLYRENSRSRRAVTNHQEAAETCPFTYPLLFDPQTAGGLLFFVSQDVCEEFVEQLSRDPGTKTAAIIGQLVEYKHDSWKESSCEIDNRSRTNRCKETTNRIYIDL